MKDKLKCGCPNPTTELKLEADFADPLWCAKCDQNLDLEDLPISPQLMKEIEDWSIRYGEWIDLDTDTLVDRGIELEDKHNKESLKIYEKLKNELGVKYELIYSPSTTAKLYKYK
ncbi:hypothetical protein [Chengkuizengella marina]|uniref:Uncharacterized protein n=1 Tax=Chengkuizengella marina TaxID=2507566 RepID=A0A6N9Q1U7_9BACL|nr:hypothetical protein [Chengkuizengella marina]NBI28154.1 hypothetical protein [Chengkuizengella marina]